jgi:hypothetical protein
MPNAGESGSSGAPASAGGAGTGAGGDSGSAGRPSGNAGLDGGEGGDTGAGGTQETPAGAAGSGGASGSAGAGGSAGSEECSRPDAPCFEPCGGDPFGNWILEGGCLAGDELEEGCAGGSIQGTLGDLNLQLTFEANGVLGASGREAWNVVARAPRACLGLDATETCDGRVLFTSALLFPPSRSLLGCQLEACGSCECSGQLDGAVAGSYRWATQGSRLTLQGSFSSPMVNVPYCVDGDVLFLGGDDSDGRSRVAYKFVKRSCTETLPACRERTLTDCGATQGCRVGNCVPTAGFQGSCKEWSEAQCEEAPDCVWDPNQCGETGVPDCDFHRCEQMPGCELGPPVARCTGQAWCGGIEADECDEPGCSVRSCSGDDIVDCDGLFPDACMAAPGCSFDGVNCTGTTRCSTQTDADACFQLSCQPGPNCWGVPARSCSSLPVADCHTLPGCHVVW